MIDDSLHIHGSVFQAGHFPARSSIPMPPLPARQIARCRRPSVTPVGLAPGTPPEPRGAPQPLQRELVARLAAVESNAVVALREKVKNVSRCAIARTERLVKELMVGALYLLQHVDPVSIRKRIDVDRCESAGLISVTSA